MRISDGSSDVCSSDLGRGMSGMIDLGRGSLVDRAVDAVRDYIRFHDLKVGDTLPGEGSFATELGVSRPVMREAFGALTALRLVEIGRAHVCTPVTNAHLVCRLLLDKKKDRAQYYLLITQP